MKTTQKGFTSEVSDCLRIGERFLLTFDDPGLEAPPYQGRLQDLRKDGLLCIDAPTDLRPPKGTSVTVSSLRNDMDDYTFSSQIYGRGRLRGRVPVILLRPPAQIEKTQRRGAYRVSVCLRAQALWTTADDPDSGVVGKGISKPGVLTNLSGGGAQIFLRARFRFPATQPDRPNRLCGSARQAQSHQFASRHDHPHRPISQEL